MKVTPEGIRDYTFNKSFRGYDKEAVNQFLQALSQEWQKEIDELATTKKQLEIAEKELNRLKDVESIMLRTIKEGDDNARKLLENAEAKSAEMISEATEKGDNYFSTKKSEGDEYWAKAENTADEIVDKAENEKVRLLTEANDTIAKLKEEAKRDLEISENEYKSLDIAKQQLLYDLNALLGNTNDRLSNIQTKYSPELFDAKKLGLNSILNAEIEIKPKKATPIAKATPKAKVVANNKTKVKVDVKQQKTPLANVVKKVVKPKLQAEIEPEDDGLPTVQKILAMTEEIQKPAEPHFPANEAEIEEVQNESKSFFDTI